MKLKVIIFWLFCGSILSSNDKVIAAGEIPATVSCDLPLDTKLLTEKDTENTESIITAETIHQDRLTIPSLWWAKEKIDTYQGKLVDNWLAYPQQKRIDLIVNWQLWDLLDYVQKYTIVNDYGAVARSYGYNLRIFDRQNRCLALYYYDDRFNPPQWQIHFNSSESNGLQIQPSDSLQLR
jgi:hypothetical protein